MRWPARLRGRGLPALRQAARLAEAKAARYRLSQAEALLDAVQREHDAAQVRLAELADAPATYSAVLEEKERHLRQSGDPRRERLMDLADERGRRSADLGQIAEAMQAASAAQQALAQVQDRLGSAAGWSTYDTFFGGRGISSAIKHSRMDEAAQAADNADRYLAVLRTELADVEPATRATASLEMDGLTRFADVWFDNIFTDLAVGDRIRQAQQNVARCVRMVSDVQAQLAKRDAQARASLTVIERERRNLLSQ